MKMITALAITLLNFNLSAADVVRGEIISVSCKGCHGVSGITNKGRHPNLAGQNAVYIVSQMKLYREGKRDFHVMNEIAAHLSDQDIEDIAAYYAGLKESYCSAE